MSKSSTKRNSERKSVWYVPGGNRPLDPYENSQDAQLIADTLGKPVHFDTEDITVYVSSDLAREAWDHFADNVKALLWTEALVDREIQRLTNRPDYTGLNPFAVMYEQGQQIGNIQPGQVMQGSQQGQPWAPYGASAQPLPGAQDAFQQVSPEQKIQMMIQQNPEAIYELMKRSVEGAAKKDQQPQPVGSSGTWKAPTQASVLPVATGVVGLTLADNWIYKGMFSDNPFVRWLSRFGANTLGSEIFADITLGMVQVDNPFYAYGIGDRTMSLSDAMKYASMALRESKGSAWYEDIADYAGMLAGNLADFYMGGHFLRGAGLAAKYLSTLPAIGRVLTPAIKWGTKVGSVLEAAKLPGFFGGNAARFAQLATIGGLQSTYWAFDEPSYTGLQRAAMITTGALTAPFGAGSVGTIYESGLPLYIAKNVAVDALGGGAGGFLSSLSVQAAQGHVDWEAAEKSTLLGVGLSVGGGMLGRSGESIGFVREYGRLVVQSERHMETYLAHAERAKTMGINGADDFLSTVEESMSTLKRERYKLKPEDYQKVYKQEKDKVREAMVDMLQKSRMGEQFHQETLREILGNILNNPRYKRTRETAKVLLGIPGWGDAVFKESALSATAPYGIVSESIPVFEGSDSIFSQLGLPDTPIYYTPTGSGDVHVTGTHHQTGKFDHGVYVPTTDDKTLLLVNNIHKQFREAIKDALDLLPADEKDSFIQTTYRATALAIDIAQNRGIDTGGGLLLVVNPSKDGNPFLMKAYESFANFISSNYGLDAKVVTPDNIKDANVRDSIKKEVEATSILMKNIVELSAAEKELDTIDPARTLGSLFLQSYALLNQALAKKAGGPPVIDTRKAKVTAGFDKHDIDDIARLLTTISLQLDGIPYTAVDGSIRFYEHIYDKKRSIFSSVTTLEDYAYNNYLFARRLTAHPLHKQTLSKVALEKIAQEAQAAKNLLATIQSWITPTLAPSPTTTSQAGSPPAPHPPVTGAPSPTTTSQAGSPPAPHASVAGGLPSPETPIAGLPPAPHASVAGGLPSPETPIAGLPPAPHAPAAEAPPSGEATPRVIELGPGEEYTEPAPPPQPEVPPQDVPPVEKPQTQKRTKRTGGRRKAEASIDVLEPLNVVERDVRPVEERYGKVEEAVFTEVVEQHEPTIAQTAEQIVTASSFEEAKKRFRQAQETIKRITDLIPRHMRGKVLTIAGVDRNRLYRIAMKHEAEAIQKINQHISDMRPSAAEAEASTLVANLMRFAQAFESLGFTDDAMRFQSTAQRVKERVDSGEYKRAIEEVARLYEEQYRRETEPFPDLDFDSVESKPVESKSSRKSVYESYPIPEDPELLRFVYEEPSGEPPDMPEVSMETPPSTSPETRNKYLDRVLHASNLLEESIRSTKERLQRMMSSGDNQQSTLVEEMHNALEAAQRTLDELRWMTQNPAKTVWERYAEFPGEELTPSQIEAKYNNILQKAYDRASSSIVKLSGLDSWAESQHYEAYYAEEEPQEEVPQPTEKTQRYDRKVSEDAQKWIQGRLFSISPLIFAYALLDDEDQKKFGPILLGGLGALALTRFGRSKYFAARNFSGRFINPAIKEEIGHVLADIPGYHATIKTKDLLARKSSTDLTIALVNEGKLREDGIPVGAYIDRLYAGEQAPDAVIFYRPSTDEGVAGYELGSVTVYGDIQNINDKPYTGFGSHALISKSRAGDNEAIREMDKILGRMVNDDSSIENPTGQGTLWEFIQSNNRIRKNARRLFVMENKGWEMTYEDGGTRVRIKIDKTDVMAIQNSDYGIVYVPAKIAGTTETGKAISFDSEGKPALLFVDIGKFNVLPNETTIRRLLGHELPDDIPVIVPYIQDGQGNIIAVPMSRIPPEATRSIQVGDMPLLAIEDGSGKNRLYYRAGPSKKGRIYSNQYLSALLQDPTIPDGTWYITVSSPFISPEKIPTRRWDHPKAQASTGSVAPSNTRIVFGDIFDFAKQHSIDAIVNPINTMGKMGAGLAAQFAERFPVMLADYQERYKQGLLKVGEPYLYRENDGTGIVNFPTKEDYRQPSQEEYITQGMEYLLQHYKEWGLKSIVFPLLGAGLGKLGAQRSLDIIHSYAPKFDIPVYIIVPENLRGRVSIPAETSVESKTPQIQSVSIHYSVATKEDVQQLKMPQELVLVAGHRGYLVGDERGIPIGEGDTYLSRSEEGIEGYRIYVDTKSGHIVVQLITNYDTPADFIRAFLPSPDPTQRKSYPPWFFDTSILQSEKFQRDILAAIKEANAMGTNDRNYGVPGAWNGITKTDIILEKARQLGTSTEKGLLPDEKAVLYKVRQTIRGRIETSLYAGLMKAADADGVPKIVWEDQAMEYLPWRRDAIWTSAQTEEVRLLSDLYRRHRLYSQTIYHPTDRYTISDDLHSLPVGEFLKDTESWMEHVEVYLYYALHGPEKLYGLIRSGNSDEIRKGLSKSLDELSWEERTRYRYVEDLIKSLRENADQSNFDSRAILIHAPDLARFIVGETVSGRLQGLRRYTRFVSQEIPPIRMRSSSSNGMIPLVSMDYVALPGSTRRHPLYSYQTPAMLREHFQFVLDATSEVLRGKIPEDVSFAPYTDRVIAMLRGDFTSLDVESLKQDEILRVMAEVAAMTTRHVPSINISPDVLSYLRSHIIIDAPYILRKYPVAEFYDRLLTHAEHVEQTGRQETIGGKVLDESWSDYSEPDMVTDEHYIDPRKQFDTDEGEDEETPSIGAVTYRLGFDSRRSTTLEGGVRYLTERTIAQMATDDLVKANVTYLQREYAKQLRYIAEEMRGTASRMTHNQEMMRKRADFIDKIAREAEKNPTMAITWYWKNWIMSQILPNTDFAKAVLDAGRSLNWLSQHGWGYIYDGWAHDNIARSGYLFTTLDVSVPSNLSKAVADLFHKYELEYGDRMRAAEGNPKERFRIGAEVLERMEPVLAAMGLQPFYVHHLTTMHNSLVYAGKVPHEELTGVLLTMLPSSYAKDAEVALRQADVEGFYETIQKKIEESGDSQNLWRLPTIALRIEEGPRLGVEPIPRSQSIQMDVGRQLEGIDSFMGEALPPGLRNVSIEYIRGKFDVLTTLLGLSSGELPTYEQVAAHAKTPITKEEWEKIREQLDPIAADIQRKIALLDDVNNKGYDELIGEAQAFFQGIFWDVPAVSRYSGVTLEEARVATRTIGTAESGIAGTVWRDSFSEKGREGLARYLAEWIDELNSWESKAYYVDAAMAGLKDEAADRMAAMRYIASRSIRMSESFPTVPPATASKETAAYWGEVAQAFKKKVSTESPASIAALEGICKLVTGNDADGKKMAQRIIQDIARRIGKDHLDTFEGFLALHNEYVRKATEEAASKIGGENVTAITGLGRHWEIPGFSFHRKFSAEEGPVGTSKVESSPFINATEFGETLSREFSDIILAAYSRFVAQSERIKESIAQLEIQTQEAIAKVEQTVPDTKERNRLVREIKKNADANLRRLATTSFEGALQSVLDEAFSPDVILHRWARSYNSRRQEQAAIDGLWHEGTAEGWGLSMVRGSLDGVLSGYQAYYEYPSVYSIYKHKFRRRGAEEEFAEEPIEEPPQEPVAGYKVPKQEGQRIYTVGYGAQEPGRMVQNLKRHNIDVLVDVRSMPTGRSGYGRQEISSMLEKNGIEYQFMGDKLGGRPSDPSVYDEAGRVDYERLAQTESFRSGIDQLVELARKGKKIVLMCAESDPLSCHRTLLVGRELARRGVDVADILHTGSLAEHKHIIERLAREEGVVPEGKAWDTLSDEEKEALLSAAYRQRSGKVAWKGGPPKSQEVSQAAPQPTPPQASVSRPVQSPPKPATQPAASVKFTEHTSPSYKDRTRQNASADATIAIAADFTTTGEKQTKQLVLEQGKKYVPVQLNRNLQVDSRVIDRIVDELNTANARTVNIAGNSLVTLKGAYTQQALDEYVYGVLKAVLESPNLRAPVERIVTGGQSGVDEAAAKAAVRLGIPVEITAPQGWRFRVDKETFDREYSGRVPKGTPIREGTYEGATYVDIASESLFKERFKGGTRTEQPQRPVVQKSEPQEPPPPEPPVATGDEVQEDILPPSREKVNYQSDNWEVEAGKSLLPFKTPRSSSGKYETATLDMGTDGKYVFMSPLEAYSFYRLWETGEPAIREKAKEYFQSVAARRANGGRVNSFDIYNTTNAILRERSMAAKVPGETRGGAITSPVYLGLGAEARAIARSLLLFARQSEGVQAQLRQLAQRSSAGETPLPIVDGHNPKLFVSTQAREGINLWGKVAAWLAENRGRYTGEKGSIEKMVDDLGKSVEKNEEVVTKNPRSAGLRWNSKMVLRDVVSPLILAYLVAEDEDFRKYFGGVGLAAVPLMFLARKGVPTRLGRIFSSYADAIETSGLSRFTEGTTKAERQAAEFMENYRQGNQGLPEKMPKIPKYMLARFALNAVFSYYILPEIGEKFGINPWVTRLMASLGWAGYARFKYGQLMRARYAPFSILADLQHMKTNGAVETEAALELARIIDNSSGMSKGSLSPSVEASVKKLARSTVLRRALIEFMQGDSQVNRGSALNMEKWTDEQWETFLSLAAYESHAAKFTDLQGMFRTRNPIFVALQSRMAKTQMRLGELTYLADSYRLVFDPPTRKYAGEVLRMAGADREQVERIAAQKGISIRQAAFEYFGTQMDDWGAMSDMRYIPLRHAAVLLWDSDPKVWRKRFVEWWGKVPNDKKIFQRVMERNIELDKLVSDVRANIHRMEERGKVDLDLLKKYREQEQEIIDTIENDIYSDLEEGALYAVIRDLTDTSSRIYLATSIMDLADVKEYPGLQNISRVVADFDIRLAQERKQLDAMKASNDPIMTDRIPMQEILVKTLEERRSQIDELLHLMRDTRNRRYLAHFHDREGDFAVHWVAESKSVGIEGNIENLERSHIRWFATRKEAERFLAHLKKQNVLKADLVDSPETYVTMVMSLGDTMPVDAFADIQGKLLYNGKQDRSFAEKVLNIIRMRRGKPPAEKYETLRKELSETLTGFVQRVSKATISDTEELISALRSTENPILVKTADSIASMGRDDAFRALTELADRIAASGPSRFAEGVLRTQHADVASALKSENLVDDMAKVYGDYNGVSETWKRWNVRGYEPGWMDRDYHKWFAEALNKSAGRASTILQRNFTEKALQQAYDLYQIMGVGDRYKQILSNAIENVSAMSHRRLETPEKIGLWMRQLITMGMLSWNVSSAMMNELLAITEYGKNRVEQGVRSGQYPVSTRSGGGWSDIDEQVNNALHLLIARGLGRVGRLRVDEYTDTKLFGVQTDPVLVGRGTKIVDAFARKTGLTGVANFLFDGAVQEWAELAANMTIARSSIKRHLMRNPGDVEGAVAQAITDIWNAQGFASPMTMHKFEGKIIRSVFAPVTALMTTSLRLLSQEFGTIHNVMMGVRSFDKKKSARYVDAMSYIAARVFIGSLVGMSGTRLWGDFFNLGLEAWDLINDLFEPEDEETTLKQSAARRFETANTALLERHFGMDHGAAKAVARWIQYGFFSAFGDVFASNANITQILSAAQYTKYQSVKQAVDEYRHGSGNPLKSLQYLTRTVSAFAYRATSALRQMGVGYYILGNKISGIPYDLLDGIYELLNGKPGTLVRATVDSRNGDVVLETPHDRWVLIERIRDWSGVNVRTSPPYSTEAEILADIYNGKTDRWIYEVIRNKDFAELFYRELLDRYRYYTQAYELLSKSERDSLYDYYYENFVARTMSETAGYSKDPEGDFRKKTDKMVRQAYAALALLDLLYSPHSAEFWQRTWKYQTIGQQIATMMANQGIDNEKAIMDRLAPARYTSASGYQNAEALFRVYTAHQRGIRESMLPREDLKAQVFKWMQRQYQLKYIGPNSPIKKYESRLETWMEEDNIYAQLNAMKPPRHRDPDQKEWIQEPAYVQLYQRPSSLQQLIRLLQGGGTNR